MLHFIHNKENIRGFYISFPHPISEKTPQRDTERTERISLLEFYQNLASELEFQKKKKSFFTFLFILLSGEFLV